MRAGRMAIVVLCCSAVAANAAHVMQAPYGSNGRAMRVRKATVRRVKPKPVTTLVTPRLQTRAAVLNAAATVGVNVSVAPAYVGPNDIATVTITVENAEAGAAVAVRVEAHYIAPDGTQTLQTATAQLGFLHYLRTLEVRGFIPDGTGYMPGTLAASYLRDGTWHDEVVPEVIGADATGALFLRVQRATLPQGWTYRVIYDVQVGRETVLPETDVRMRRPPAVPGFGGG